MHRTKPALYLKRSPLVYVVAQVRFSAIVKMEQYIPDIQEKVRHEGFPKFSRGRVTEVRIEADREAQFTASDRWEFQNKESTLGVVVSTGSLAVHTSKYNRYEEFEKTVDQSLRVLNVVASPSLVERIGLRYVDLVQPGDNETFADYLQPGILGLDAARFQARNPLHRYQFTGRTEAGHIVVRWWQNDAGVILPPDLGSSTLRHEAKAEAGKVVGILDLDHFTEDGTSEFDVSHIADLLGSLHGNLDLAFRSAVTPKALEVWGSEP